MEDFIFETYKERSDGLRCPPRRINFDEDEREPPPYDLNNDNGRRSFNYSKNILILSLDIYPFSYNYYHIFVRILLYYGNA